MLGYKDESEFRNTQESWTSNIHPEDQERIARAIVAHVTDTTGQTPFEEEFRFRLKSGDYHWFRAVGTTLRDEKGKALKVIGAFVDILSFSGSIHPDDAEKVRQSFFVILNDRTGQTPFDLEFCLRLKNGEYRWFHAKGKTLCDDNGAPLQFAGTIDQVHICV